MPLSYAFLSRQNSPSRILIARHSENEVFATEMVCFVVTIPDGQAKLPEERALLSLRPHNQPPFRAGAAGALPVSETVWMDDSVHDVPVQRPALVAQIVADHVNDGFFG